MNILRKELKAGLKPFLFWSLGLFALVFAGLMKSAGTTADAEGLSAMVSAFPKIVLAVFGMLNVDVGTFPGFYAVLAQYVIVLAAVYGVHLGNSALSREAVDKTYEFVFTKPRSRSHILFQKLLAGFLFLVVFCFLNLVFSIMGASTLNMTETYTRLFAIYSLAALLVGFLFFGLGAMFAALSKTSETGAKLGNYAVMIGFCLSVVYDMLDGAGWLRILAPFRYFSTPDLFAFALSPWFVPLSLLIAAIALFVAFERFEKRDLNAV